MRLIIYTILLYHIPPIKIKGFCDIFTLVLLILYYKKAALVRAAQSTEKILGLCKRSEELLCPKRSTGTFGRIKRDFALCGGRRGAPPLDPATFEKVDETFSVVLICSDFSVLFVSISLVLCPLLTAVNSKSVLAASFGDVHSDVGGGVKLLEVLAVIGGNSHTYT